MFRRFRKRIMRSQLLSTVRKKRWFISKGEQRRIDQKKGIQRAQKRLRRTNNRY
ncbi:MAG: 30S ribosomal protein S21 [Chloroflexi bacterium]|nr:30S ribosomal protein S21 [Chloroflexota bacterium]